MLGRLTSLTDWQSRVLTLTYDANGRRTGVTRPGGTATAYAYDTADRQTSVTHTGPGGTLQTFVSTYDAASNRTSVTSGIGTESYTLDALNRLTSVTYPGGGGTVSYTYDANGNRLTKVAGGVTTSYAYDNADQLLTEGAVTYTYDAAGNVTGNGTATYTWDWAGRLASVTQGGVTTSYSYDGDDVRVRRTQGGTTTNYVWDRESGLPLLVDDGTHAYLHGGGLQGELDAANAPRYPLTDGLGSVRGLTGLAGTSLGTADYDAFGSVRASTGQSSVFGYTGEQTDSETGFSYLRARLYNPASGRFLSRDSVSPNAPGTQGYNAYAYVANNPSTWTDPSGHAIVTTPRVVSAQILIANLKLTGACIQTIWCATGLGIGALHLATPVELVQWVGFGYTWISLLVCAMDNVRIDAEGPEGLFIRGGDHCFEYYGKTSSNIPDCTWRLAMFCIPSPGGGGSCTRVPTPRIAVPLCVAPQEPSGPVWPTPQGDTNCSEPWEPGPYKDLPDVRSEAYRQSRGFDSKKQRYAIMQANWERNGSRVKTNEHGDTIWILRSDGDGREMEWNASEQKITTPRNEQNSPQIDHICPLSKRGGSDNANACILSQEENIRRNQTATPPYRCGPVT